MVARHARRRPDGVELEQIHDGAASGRLHDRVDPVPSMNIWVELAESMLTPPFTVNEPAAASSFPTSRSAPVRASAPLPAGPSVASSKPFTVTGLPLVAFSSPVSITPPRSKIGVEPVDPPAVAVNAPTSTSVPIPSVASSAIVTPSVRSPVTPPASPEPPRPGSSDRRKGALVPAPVSGHVWSEPSTIGAEIVAAVPVVLELGTIPVSPLAPAPGASVNALPFRLYVQPVNDGGVNLSEVAVTSLRSLSLE
jgi:hypothetical protein